MKPTMGFATKYYTYWLVSKPYNTVHGDYQYTKVDYQYVQNLSFDEGKAKKRIVELSGDTNFKTNLGLRGSKSFKRTVQTKYLGTGFAFGKYINKSFLEVDDTSYKLWYYRQTRGTSNHSQELEDSLKASGLLVDWNGEWHNINKLERMVRDYIAANIYQNGFHDNDGERKTLTLRMRGEYSVETYYGTMYIANFLSEDLKLYFYKGSKSTGLERGDKANITARINHNKYYSERDGSWVTQTLLKRPKIEIID